MEVIPAIDIKNGKCVRLYQGDYGRETVYSESPVEVALRWVEEGATRLHVVDLDGARAGGPVHLGIVGEIAAATAARVQLGGGIRDAATAGAAVALGVDRVILGTAAVERPDLLEELSRELGGEAVLVGVDVRYGDVALEGWTRGSGITASELVKRVGAAGVRRFIYTDITRDGTLTEPNFRAIEELLGQTSLNMLVAGGVSSVEHLRRLDDLGVEAAIVGKAVYTGDIDLREAIDAISG
jgi:phosphoribosylformimino-5-aminoimidazole carboxamide ribotide isomerase